MPQEWELYIHALADVVFVFHLGLGKRRAAGDAPIHRLLAAINESLLNDIREQPQLLSLIFLLQRDIGIVPIAEDAEPLELNALDVEIFESISLAGLANRGGI